MSLGPDPSTSRRAGKMAWATRQSRAKAKRDPFAHYVRARKLDRDAEKAHDALNAIVSKLNDSDLAAYQAKVAEYEAKKESRTKVKA